MLPVDSVELNAIKAVHSELSEIAINCEIMVLISLGVLYAALCPIVSVVAFLLLFVDNLADNWMKQNIYQRKLPQPLGTITPWTSIQQIISLFAIITNSVLLFAYSTEFRYFVFGVSDIKKQLYNVVILQHVYIFFPFVIRMCFPASKVKPKQVKEVSSGGGSAD